MLSSTNSKSAVIQINVGHGKFLFTADAEIDSFHNIQDYKKLKNANSLTVHHHCSTNNLKVKLIQPINPKIAFISGDGHIPSLVVKALHAYGKNNTHYQQCRYAIDLPDFMMHNYLPTIKKYFRLAII